MELNQKIDIVRIVLSVRKIVLKSYVFFPSEDDNIVTDTCVKGQMKQFDIWENIRLFFIVALSDFDFDLNSTLVF